MNFVENFDLFGIKAKEIPCIRGAGAPDGGIEGAVGCFYMNTDNGDLYKCLGVDDYGYVWTDIVDAQACYPQPNWGIDTTRPNVLLRVPYYESTMTGAVYASPMSEDEYDSIMSSCQRAVILNPMYDGETGEEIEEEYRDVDVSEIRFGTYSYNGKSVSCLIYEAAEFEGERASLGLIGEGSAIVKIPRDYLDCGVKTVNGVAPDLNGNIVIEVPSGADDAVIGDIFTALDHIIELQNSLIGGDGA